MTLYDGLVAYYNFDNNVEDKSGNGNDGTNNGATYVTGKKSQGLNFDGNNDYVQLPDNLLNSVESTRSVWFYVNGDGRIITERDYSVAGRGISVGSGTLKFFSRYSGDNYISVSNTINYNQWNYVVGVQTLNQLLLYVNGVLVDNVTQSNLEYSWELHSLGLRQIRDNWDNYFDGKIDEVGIWNRALTSTEVEELWNNGEGKALYPTTLNTGLVYASHFNNGTATDWSGNNNDGTVNGATATADKNGDTDSALSFDGSDDYVDIPNITNSEPFSVSIWAKADQTSNTAFIIAQEDSGEGFSDDYQLYVSEGDFRYGVTSDNGVLQSADTNWHHFMIVNDSDEMKFYINTILLATRSLSYTDLSDGILRIGQKKGGSYWDGLIDEPRIYNRALSDYEILQLYCGYDTEEDSINTLPEGCVAYYKFDEGSGSTVIDATGNGNDGNISGATYTTGIVNQGLSFDGSNDYVDIPNNFGIFDGSQDFSISAWFKADSLSDNTIIAFQGEHVVIIGVGNDEFAPTRDLYFGIREDNNDRISVGHNISSSQWYHFTAVYIASTGGMRLYVDSVLEDTNAVTSIQTNNGDNTIGLNDYGGGTSAPFNGLIDEVVIFNKSLTQEEVDFLYANGTPGEPQQYPFISESGRLFPSLLLNNF